MNRHHNNNNNNNPEQRAEEDHHADADDIGGDKDSEDESNQNVEDDDDDDSDSEENEVEGEDDDDDDSDGDSDEDDSGVEEVVPKPEEVELECTYPRDFVGRSWEEVVRGRFFRLILDPSCTEITVKKFQDCDRLIEIVVPKNSALKWIQRSAFSTCRNLQRITNGLPTTLVLMEEKVFEYCTALHGRLVIPPNVTFLGNNCFYFCYRLTSVVFEASTSTAGIEQTTVVLGGMCFSNCMDLQSVRLPQTLITIPSSCFLGCGKLTDIPIPKSVQRMQGWSFADCKSLRSIDLSENVDELGARLFRNCASLESITIRSSSSNIQFGDHFLIWCPSLSTIKVYPWHFPKIFRAMKYVNNCSLTDAVVSASFIYNFFHKYHHQILEDEAEVGVVTRQHRNGRRRRRISRNPQKRQRLQG